MSSDRPETSFPDQSSSEPTSSPTKERSLPILTGENYVPRANDLVIASSRIPPAAGLEIPFSLMQSEAVDSSLLLGHGASFTVTRQAVPPGPGTMMDCFDFGKLIDLKMPYQGAKRPKYVVYKSPRIEFQPDGKPTTPQDRRALQSVLTEIHALVHPPILANANIIDILGVAWGSNHANPLHRLPVLVVEYGDRGTLADVQLNKVPLPNELKLEIALGIANGLQTLHEEGIIHGDLKPENIIMFSDKDKTLIPKLADFGFSVVEESLESDVILGGTRTWRAPESYASLKVSGLAPTDVYSFGLVVWSIALDGWDPFRVLISAHLSSEERYRALDRLKADDKLQDLSIFENWVPRWRSCLTSGSVPEPCDEDSTNESHLANECTTCMYWRQQAFFNVLEDVLLSTLSLQPGERDLSMAIRLLKEGMNTEFATQQLASIDLSETPTATRPTMSLSFQPARNEEPAHPYSEKPDDNPSTSPDMQSPSLIEIQLHEGKSSRELDPRLTNRLPMSYINPAEQPGAQPNPDPRVSCILFQIRFTFLAAGRLVETSLAMGYQVAEGIGLGFKIPKRTERRPVKVNRTDVNGVTTWIVAFPQNNARQRRSAEADDTPHGLLPNGVDVMRRHVGAKKAYWSAFGYKTDKLSWQSIRSLDPAIQRFIVSGLSQRSNANAMFTLCAAYLNGYGVPVDIDTGLSILVRSARQRGFEAQANVYRLHKACGRQVPADLPVAQLLEHAATQGSRMALQDLADVDKEKALKIRVKLRNDFGGVGVGWYQNGHWRLGLSSEKLRQDDFDVAGLGPRTEIPTMVVNDRGDRILHAAAATGAVRLVAHLLEALNIDVDQRNKHGETALLCATRSGHAHVVKILLNHGASASIQADNGESPLHWLLSFSGDLIPDIGKALIETGGAVVDAFTNQNISHSEFPSTIDVNYQLPGTPLAWAVRENRADIVSFLLSAGANPQMQSPSSRTSPLLWAAHMHHTACLRLMISHLERSVENGGNAPFDGLFYDSVIWMAIHGSDRFSMILRNGADYLAQLEATLKLLQEKMRSRHFFVTQDQELPLGFAVSQAHDEAAEIILKLRWGVEGINRPNSSNGRTPLLHAVHWNRRHVVSMLREHGADARVKARNPFDQARCDWSALHVFAEQAHDDDLALVSDLLDLGVPVDGQDGVGDDSDVETPLFVAIRKNAFKLADLLLSKGASLNALSTRSSLLVSTFPLTGLGHIIALNARHCVPSLRYLLAPHTDVTTATVDFIVEPTRRLSALHLCAMVPHDLRYTSGDELSPTDFDYETNRRIMHELLDYFPESKYLDERCSLKGRTALHLAAEYGNVEAAAELVKAGASIDMRDDEGQTAAQIARNMHGKDEEKLRAILEWLEEGK